MPTAYCRNYSRLSDQLAAAAVVRAAVDGTVDPTMHARNVQTILVTCAHG